MITCFKCEKCGRIFDDLEKADQHESKHFTVKGWHSDNDQKVVDMNTEYEPELYAPSAVVVPMMRTFWEDGELKEETAYVKYYYSAKKAAEQVFPVDESIIG